MVAVNNTQYALKPDSKTPPNLMASTRKFLEKYGLEASRIPAYCLNDYERAVDVLRLTHDQLALIPPKERPLVLPERNGLDVLMYVVDGFGIDATTAG